jgi:hypothetical protein
VRVLAILISLVCVALPIEALAKPKPTIAVAPLDGDDNNKVAQAVVDALAGKDFVVIGPKEVSREKKKLGLSDELDPKDARKLATKLGAVAIVDGKVSKAGKKRSLHLEIHRRGKPDSGFTVEFKSTSSDGFRRGVHEEIAKKLDGAGDDDPANDDDDQAKQLAARRAAADDGERKRKLTDDDAEKRTKKPPDDDDRKRKLTDDDTEKRTRKPPDDDDRKRKLTDDDAEKRTRKPPDDDDRKRKLADDTGKRTKKPPDDDEPATARRKRVANSDEPAVRKRKGRKQLGDDQVAPQVLARVSAGGIVAQRRLTYDVRSGLTPKQAPPRVITTAGAGRVEGEIYPLALAGSSGGLAGLGLAGAYDKTFGLSIKIPNQPLRAPIDQAHYAVGARYRFGVGEASAIVIGVDYVRRHYIADRSSLMAIILDAPDVDYTAVAPGLAAHVPVTPAITLFGGLDGMLILNTGSIQKTTSYGSATVYGVELLGGLDIALAKQLGLRVALEYSQINFSFSGKGMMAMLRDTDSASQDVNGATDRSIGATVTLGLMY